jgi:hypothetical protein
VNGVDDERPAEAVFALPDDIEDAEPVRAETPT